MSKRNTPKGELFEQYEREYRRIQQAIRRQEKLGYYIPEDLKPIKPSKVKNVTQSDINRLIELTPKEIRKNSVYVDPSTGEVYEGLDVVKSHHTAKASVARVRQKSDPKPKQITASTRRKRRTKIPPKENNLNLQIIDDIKRMIESFEPRVYWSDSFKLGKYQKRSMIDIMLYDEIREHGEYAVAHRLEQNATELIALVERILYDSDSRDADNFNMSRFVELLIGRPLTQDESDMYSEMAQDYAMDALRGENSIG